MLGFTLSNSAQPNEVKSESDRSCLIESRGHEVPACVHGYYDKPPLKDTTLEILDVCSRNFQYESNLTPKNWDQSMYLHVHRWKVRSWSRVPGGGHVFTYWCYYDIVPIDITIHSTKWMIQSRPDNEWLDNAVQASSYAMLLYLHHGMFHDATPIMRWMNNQRMDYLKFAGDLVTTQIIPI